MKSWAKDKESPFSSHMYHASLPSSQDTPLSDLPPELHPLNNHFLFSYLPTMCYSQWEVGDRATSTILLFKFIIYHLRKTPGEVPDNTTTVRLLGKIRWPLWKPISSTLVRRVLSIVQKSNPTLSNNVKLSEKALYNITPEDKQKLF